MRFLEPFELGRSKERWLKRSGAEAVFIQFEGAAVGVQGANCVEDASYEEEDRSYEDGDGDGYCFCCFGGFGGYCAWKEVEEGID